MTAYVVGSLCLSVFLSLLHISLFKTLGRTFSSLIWYKVYTVNSFIHEIYNKTLSIVKKKLSCRTETARRFVSLNIWLNDSRSLKVIEMTVEYRA